MKIQLRHTFEDIISCENLLGAWEEFARGKHCKRDAAFFALHLADNIFQLREDLYNRTYKHGGYQAFYIFDPKPRHIHKASVRDRLLHHAIYRRLYPFFDRTFIADSYSCRINRGTHKALNRFRCFSYRASRNHTKICWVLKCDIKKFFENIDHNILRDILREYIPDKNILWLLNEVIDSFHAREYGKGLPLGNLTSQLFVNLYMNVFDQFAKHKLKAKFYVRYADDFVFFSQDRRQLEAWIPIIREFLAMELKLVLHPSKIYLRTIISGVDFLGWTHFSNHRTLRTATKKRMIKKLKRGASSESLQAYLGLLRHGNTYKLRNFIAGLYI